MKQGTSKELMTSLLDNLPSDISSLARSNEIGQRVAQHGFDWPSWHGAHDKVNEELNEVAAELSAQEVNQGKVSDELGDLLFSVVNLIRMLKLDPEQIMTQANDKFEARFRAVEAQLLSQGLNTRRATLAQMEKAWQEVKMSERKD